MLRSEGREVVLLRVGATSADRVRRVEMAEMLRDDELNSIMFWIRLIWDGKDAADLVSNSDAVR